MGTWVAGWGLEWLDGDLGGWMGTWVAGWGLGWLLEHHSMNMNCY